MITYPPVIINEYFAENVEKRLPGRFVDKINFYPTKPTDPTAVKGAAFKNLAAGPDPKRASEEGSSDVFVIYDRIFRLRKRSFPHIKTEQLIYYLYAKTENPEPLIESVQVVHDLFDRQDESGQEINSWIGKRVDAEGNLSFGEGIGERKFKPVFFHETRVFQLEETRYVINSRADFAAAKVIINYDYHTRDYK